MKPMILRFRLEGGTNDILSVFSLSSEKSPGRTSVKAVRSVSAHPKGIKGEDFSENSRSMVFKKGSVEKQSSSDDEFDASLAWKTLESLMNASQDHEPVTEQEHQYSLIPVPFRRPEYVPRPDTSTLVCDLCGDINVTEIYADGNFVCQACGYVSSMPVYVDCKILHDGTIATVLMHSSYKRIHYCNERIHQWLCRDHWMLPPSELTLLRHMLMQQANTPLAISNGDPGNAETAMVVATPMAPPTHVSSGGLPFISKNKIRIALRAIGKPHLVERWVTILCQLSKTGPPCPDSYMVQTMRELFCYIEIAFNIHKPHDRKSMIHYNFVFVRILQFLGQTQYYRFFPLLKSRAKVRSIDAVWHKIADCLGWKYLPIPNAKAFKA